MRSTSEWIRGSRSYHRPRLTEAERRELELQIMNLTGKQALAKYAIDPKLIGGAMISIGSTIYDGSVRGQLQKMKEQLQVVSR